jgi:hypothetical protein
LLLQLKRNRTPYLIFLLPVQLYRKVVIENVPSTLARVPLVEVIQVEVAADTVLLLVEEAVLQVVEVAVVAMKFLEISNDY